MATSFAQPAPGGDLPRLVEALFREAHSLKGAARAVGRSEIEAVSAVMESELARLKRHEVEPSPALYASLERGVDAVRRLLAGEPETSAPPLVAAPSMAAAAGPAAALAGTPRLQVEGDETVRIATAKLAALLVQSEELLAFKFSFSRLASELGAAAHEAAVWKKSFGATAHATGLRRARQAGEDIALARLGSAAKKASAALEGDVGFAQRLSERLGRVQRMAEQERRILGGVVDSLQGEMKRALMQPFSTLFELLPRLVRDLSRDGGKEVETEIAGAAIEIDRRILEQMKDPLIHLARNAIDHGIEPVADRLQRGKKGRGRLTIAVTPLTGNQVELLFADDGAGIDLDKVRAAAIRLGLIAPADMESQGGEQLATLVFESGLTTRVEVTDISGRGLGLPIVREKVEKLGGSVGIETTAGSGTQFRIVLPTMLANFRGLLVALGDRQFVLPSQNVERVARVAAASVKTVENREAIELAGQVVALVRLSDVLGLSASPGAAGALLPVAVLSSAGKRIAFAVDAVLGDQEVLVKGLGPQLRRVRNIAGATVLGDGVVVPVLDVPDLFTSSLRLAARRSALPASTASAMAPRSLLVVEDSITSRALLKNILESAGYLVATAVDGVDALLRLRSGRFDLVVSDVEMPRMDGFDLTSRIRADKRLAELPVVLVTALESPQHRERGMDVGASAFIVKSSFDQSNLLEVIRRLT